MSKLNIPESHQAIMPYLIVENADLFSRFMQDAFGAKERLREMRDDKTIMHAELELNGSTIMFADTTEKFAPQNAGLFVYVADCNKSFERATADGATIINPPTDQPYGRTAGILDPFGNTWWITSAS